MDHPARPRPGELALFGLDVGSTTTRAMVASCPVLRNAATGRTEVGPARHREICAPALTPFAGGDLDVGALERLLDGWLAECGLGGGDVGGGGALLTGLAGRARGAPDAVALVRARIRDAVVVTAADPHLESWLAFMGGCRALSRAHPERTFAHLDIGGGTANLAVGRDGEVSRVACIAVGARHLTVEPGTFRITGVTEWGRAALAALEAPREVGEVLDGDTVARLIAGWVAQLERACEEAGGEAVRTFSGGVGELVYALAGGSAVGRTSFGDLGGELARAILASPLGRDARTHVPPERGHATVIGLTLWGTTVSGATIHLPRPEMLPLRDVPIVARLPAASAGERLRAALALAAASPAGVAVQVALAGESAAEARALGETLAALLAEVAPPAAHPVVVLLDRNLGKVVGQYASRWGASPVALIVLDEVGDTRARFVNLGSVRNGAVPVSFHGL